MINGSALDGARHGYWHGCSWLLALLVALTPSAFASRIDIDQIGHLPAVGFDDSDGLPDPTVTAVATAPDGHVWVGTMRGLARFNGLRMVPVRGPDPAFDGAVRDVAVTPDGVVWVAFPDAGVWRLPPSPHGAGMRAGRWQQVDAGLPHPSARRLRWFADGAHGYRLFVTAWGGVAEWRDGRWEALALPDVLRDVDIFDVVLAPGAGSVPGGSTEYDPIHLATFGLGLWRCDAPADCVEVVPDIPGPRFFEISSLATWTEAEGGDSLWVGSYGGGVARLHAGRWTRYTRDAGALDTDFVQRLLLQDVGRMQPQVWVGLRDGAARLRDGRWESLDYLARIGNQRTRALALGADAQGRPQVWVGTDVGAIRLRLEGSWRTVSRLGDSANGVWAVLVEQGIDGHEALWLGSDGDGLARFRDGQWRHWTAADGLPNPTVRSLARVADGADAAGDAAETHLWIGMWNGHLARIAGERIETLPTPWPKADREAVAFILPTAAGEAWVGLRQGGVARWNRGRWQWFDPADPANPQRVVALLQTGSGSEAVMWASTVGRGLAAYRGGRWFYYGTAEGLPDDAYYGITLLPDAGGRQILWLGSRASGIVRVDITNPQQPRLVTEPALPATPVPYAYAVVRDGAGDLIVCSDYGAARWRPRSDGGFDVLRFQRSDGLPHDECNAGALVTDAHGRVWAGTIGGAAVYVPPLSGRRTAAPPLLLEALRVDGADVAPAEATPLRLPLGARTLEVEFALLSGHREALNRYRTWLEGLEPGWGEWTPVPVRHFTGLPPGSYRLHVDARDHTGARAAPLSIAFEIPVPAWRAPPALAAYAIGLLLLAWVSVRLRERHLRRREAALLVQVRERTQELEARGRELKQANAELSRLSYFDALTELANRRSLLERLHRDWAAGLGRGTPLAFALFDLDEFKAYNDLKGHLAGDEALRVVARRVEAELRKPQDTAGRYGGEEFALLLPGLDLQAAAAVAERVRQAVLHADLPHPGSPQGRVTISIGVAAMVPQEGVGAEVLIAAADAALYRAKHAGKNRVELA
ncbi:diguanylate cyclase domain-containing protein [Arenimonas composti]|nr:diguanylate cyclase [Arenimonas composti]